MVERIVRGTIRFCKANFTMVLNWRSGNSCGHVDRVNLCLSQIGIGVPGLAFFSQFDSDLICTFVALLYYPGRNEISPC